MDVFDTTDSIERQDVLTVGRLRLNPRSLSAPGHGHVTADGSIARGAR